MKCTTSKLLACRVTNGGPIWSAFYVVSQSKIKQHKSVGVLIVCHFWRHCRDVTSDTCHGSTISSADCLWKLNHAAKVGGLYRSCDVGFTVFSGMIWPDAVQTPDNHITLKLVLVLRCRRSYRLSLYVCSNSRLARHSTANTTGSSAVSTFQPTQRTQRNETTSLLDRPITAACDDGVCRWHTAKLWQTHAVKYEIIEIKFDLHHKLYSK